MFSAIIQFQNNFCLFLKILFFIRFDIALDLILKRSRKNKNFKMILLWKLHEWYTFHFKALKFTDHYGKNQSISVFFSCEFMHVRNS